jgi:CBS domain-containing protein
MANSKQQDTTRVHKQAKGVDAAAREAVRDADDAAQQGAEAGEQSGRAASDVLRRSGEATAEAAWHGGEAMRRGVRALAENHREFVQGAAEQFEEAGRKVVQAMQQTTEDWCALMVMPNAGRGSLQDLQEGVAGLVEGVIRTNLRATQELFRPVNPGAIVDLQRRLARDCLDAFMQGSALMVRATHRAAEETLRPLEAGIEQRQRARHGQSQQGWSSNSAARHDGKVADVMSTQVRVIGPDDTVQQAARIMREQNVGALPVGEGDRLVGMVTDRDVALRLVAEGRDPARTKVREVMTPDVRYIFEDEELGHAAENMAEQKVRRLPVVNRDKRLVGVLSLGDLAVNGNQRWLAGRAIADTTRETDEHVHAAAE